MDEHNAYGECSPAYEPAPLPAPEAKRRFSRIGWAFAAMVVLQQAGQAVVVAAAQMLKPALLQSSWFLMCMNFLPLYFLGFPLLLAVLRGLPGLPPLAARRLRPARFAQLALASLAAVYALNYGSVWINEFIGRLKGGDVVNPLERLVLEDSSPWAVLLFVVLLAPVFEEYVFRGLLYQKLAAFGAKTYILFSALVFALYHVNFYQMFYAFALGLVLAGLTYYTGNIRASVALHLLVNLIGSGLPLLVTSFGGGELSTMLFGRALILIGVLGLTSAVLLLSRRGELSMPAGICPPPEGRAIFGNSGMAVLLAILAALTVFVVMAG